MVTLEEVLRGSTRTVSLRRTGSNKVESYQVKIPRGVHEGQRIRLAGQGEAGERGGKSGDLFLRVRLARHPDFSVEGTDLIHEAKIAPWQAVLGTELKVPTPEGDVRLKVPPARAADSDFACANAVYPPARERAAIFMSMCRSMFPKKSPNVSASSGASWRNCMAINHSTTIARVR